MDENKENSKLSSSDYLSLTLLFILSFFICRSKFNGSKFIADS